MSKRQKGRKNATQPSPSKRQRQAESSQSDNALNESTPAMQADTNAHTVQDNTNASSSPSVEEDEDVTINVSAQRKPDFSMPSSALRDRLRSFLPELAEANAGLSGSAEESVEHVEENAPCIDMDLGLGVLEEHHSDSSDTSSDEESEEEQDKTSVLQKLMGSSEQAENRRMIQEVTPPAG